MVKLIKQAVKHYKNKVDDNMFINLEQSSSPSLQRLYNRKFDMQKYALFKGRELKYVFEYYKYYKYKGIILYLLESLCNVYNQENSFLLLDNYLLPVVEKSNFNSSNVIKYSLSIDPQLSKTLSNIYLDPIMQQKQTNTFMLDEFRKYLSYHNCMGINNFSYNIAAVRNNGINYLSYEEACIFNLWYNLDLVYVNLNYLYAIIDL